MAITAATTIVLAFLRRDATMVVTPSGKPR
jgi:hypothetical protein